MVDALTAVGAAAAVAATACNPPNISIPNPPDILALIEEALSALGIAIPHLPSVPQPPAFCPLD